jgi:hypothetical protein
MPNHQLDLFDQLQARPDIHIRESKRARHLCIQVSESKGVEVVVPPRTGPHAVRQFVEANRDWIHHARNELDVSAPSPQLFLPDHIAFRFNSETYSVTYQHKTPRRGWRETGPGRLELSCARANYESGHRILHSWLRHKGREILVPQLAQRAQAMDASYRQVQVRGQHTRWGSYSSSGTLSINYCLLFVPADLADYLFIHELCHTRHMNHSAQFWQLVSRFAPNYRAQDKRLNDGRKYLPDWLKVA